MLEEDVAINDSSSFINNSYQGKGPVKLSHIMNKSTNKKKTGVGNGSNSPNGGSPKRDIEFEEAFPDDDDLIE